jgi:hypothetical protein
VRLRRLVPNVQIESIHPKRKDSRNRQSEKSRLRFINTVLQSLQHQKTHHSSNNQPVIQSCRPLDSKPCPQSRNHHAKRHNTHRDDARRRAPVPRLRVDIVWRRPFVVCSITRREQGRSGCHSSSYPRGEVRHMGKWRLE